MFEVGQVGVPAQGHHVDINHAVGGRHEEEIEDLRRRPHAPVSLERSQEQAGASPGIPAGGRAQPWEGIYLVEFPEFLLQLVPALLERLLLQGADGCGDRRGQRGWERRFHVGNKGGNCREMPQTPPSVGGEGSQREGDPGNGNGKEK